MADVDPLVEQEVQKALQKEQILRRYEGGQEVTSDDQNRIRASVMDQFAQKKADEDIKRTQRIEDTNAARVAIGLPPLEIAKPIIAPAAPAVTPASVESGTPLDFVPQPQKAMAPAITPKTNDVNLNPFAAGNAQMRKAIAEQEKVGQLVAAEKVGASDEIQKAAQARHDELINLQAQKDKDLEEAEKKRVEASQSLKDFKFQDYWANKSTGAKIAAALAIGLGAYSASINGGTNQAASIIDNAVKNDIELQRKQFEKLQGVASDADSAYSRLYKRLGDKDLASQQLYISGLEAAKAKGDASLARIGGEMAKANAAQSLGELQMKIDSAKAEYGLKIEEIGAKKRSAQAQMQENYIPALGIYATSKEGAGKVNELAGATRSAQDGIGQLLSLTTVSGKSLSPETRAKAQTTASLVKAALRVPILGPGTVNDAERALMDKIVANPALVFSLDEVNKVRLKSLSERLEANLRQQAKAYELPTVGTGPLSTGMVKVKLPDGRVGLVPAHRLEYYRSNNAEIIQ